MSSPGKQIHLHHPLPTRREAPPYPIALGLALQYSILALGGIVLTVAIVIRSAGSSEAYLAWGALRGAAGERHRHRHSGVAAGAFGIGIPARDGHLGAFIAVSVAALQQGGPGLLATLVIISSLFQFLLAGRLSLLRRILTPTVAGTVIMLIAVNVMPFLFDFLDNVPAGSAPLAAPVTVLSTLGIHLGGDAPVHRAGPSLGALDRDRCRLRRGVVLRAHGRRLPRGGQVDRAYPRPGGRACPSTSVPPSGRSCRPTRS